MYKRGQATLFIILGIVLVVIIVLLFTTKTIELPRRSVESSQLSPVRDYVEQCIDEIANEWIYLLGQNGGSVISSSQSVRFKGFNIAYLCYSPTGTKDDLSCYHDNLKEKMEKNLAEYVKSNLGNCLVGLDESFQNRDISQTLKSVDVIISDYRVALVVEMPLEIRRGNEVISMDKFTKIVEVPLGKLTDVAAEITEQSVERWPYHPNIDAFISRNLGLVKISIDKDDWTKSNIYVLKIDGEENKFEFKFALGVGVI